VIGSFRACRKREDSPTGRRRKAIKKAASEAGISKRVGFHRFRHALSSLLRQNGEDVKVVQELLPLASSRSTPDTYTQAASPAKRAAQAKVKSMVLGYNQLQIAGSP